MKAFFTKSCLAACLLVLSGCGAGLCIQREYCSTGALLTSAGGVNFGARGFYTTPSMAVTLTNEGMTAATQISAGSVSSPFSFLGGSYPGTGGTCGTTLGPSGTCTMVFSFTVPVPPAADYSGTLELSYYDGSANKTTTLSILGTADNGTLATIRGFGGSVNSIAIASDGIYATGTFYSYGTTRLNRMAKLDFNFDVVTSFNTGTGFTGFNTMGGSVALPLPGGDVLIAGQMDSYNGTAIDHVARLNSDGTLDAGLVQGTGFNDTWGYPRTAALALDSSGDVYIGGGSHAYDGTAINYLTRLNSDGSVDAGFNIGAGFNLVVGDPVKSIVAAPDTVGNAVGDLYVGGKYTTFDGTAGVGSLVRVNPNGSRDTLFATGTGLTGGFAAAYTIALALDGSGTLYVGGDFTTFNGAAGLGNIVRINPDGSRDTAFATGTGFNSAVSKILPALDSSGDVYVYGGFTSFNGTPVKNLIRLNADGTVDTGFAGVNPSGPGIATLDDGTYDLILAGNWSNGTTFVQGPVRVAPDGSAKSSVGGISDTTGARFNLYPSWIAPVSDGKIYVGGSMTSYGVTTVARILRLTPEGEIDTSFAVGTGLNSGPDHISPAADSSGDIYLSGSFSTYNGTAGLGGVLRLNSDGSRDTAFATGTGANSQVTRILPANDGSGDVYLSGYFTTFNGTPGVNRIVRLNSNGSIDAAFATGSGFAGGVGEMALAADGDLYVGKFSTTYNGIAGLGGIIRLNPDGSRDTAFATGSGFNSNLNVIVPTTDGSGDVYIGGQFSTFNGSPVGSVVRLNSDGSLDTAFTFLSSSVVTAMALVPGGGGDIFVGGQFDTYNSVAALGFVRLNSDGSIDSDFNSGGFDEWNNNQGAFAMLPAQDGTNDIYVAHPYYSYLGTATGFISRIAPDGTME